MKNRVCLKYFVDDFRRLRDFERDTTEINSLELTICKKIWLIIFAYGPPINNTTIINIYFQVNSQIL